MRHRAFSWYRELGAWNLVDWRWVGVDGTTPTNADVWTLNLRVGGRRRWGSELWLRVGVHWGFTAWVGLWSVAWHARGKKCDCYDCLVAGGPVRWFR